MVLFIQRQAQLNSYNHGNNTFVFISVINQLDAQNVWFTISLFHASTCFEHHVLIIRRSKLRYTASGIITPIGAPLVHRLREDCSLVSVVCCRVEVSVSG